MRCVRVVLCTIASVGAVACGGRTQGEVLTEYGQRFEKRVEQIERLVAQLPPPGSIQEDRTRVTLDPPLVYDQSAGQCNCDIIHLEQLRAPLSEVPLDLRLGFDLHKYLMWTSPDGFMRKRDDDAGDLASKLDATLARPYLVVHRTVELVLPVAVDAKTYEPGRAEFEGFVLDLAGDRVVASYRIAARTREEAGYRASGGTDALAASARSAMWTQARDLVKDALQEITGTRIVVD